MLSAALALVTPVLLYLAPLSKAEYIAPERHGLLGFFCLILAAAAGYKAYGVFSSGDRTKIAVVAMAAGALSCLVLLIDAFSFFKDGRLTNKLKIPNLIPVLWALSLTVSNFSITTSYLNNSVLLINIFADAFLMLFLFQFAKKFSGIYGDENSPIYIYSALMCALLELTAFSHSVLSGSYSDLYRPAAALFCMAALAVMLKNKVPDYVPETDEVVETVPFRLSPEELKNNTDEAPAAEEVKAAETPETTEKAAEVPATEEAAPAGETAGKDETNEELR